MDRDYLIQLTNNLYSLTLLFPKKEPLRYKMRELASSILAEVKQEDLEALNSFFEVVKAQNWVSPSDILAIQKEYDNLRQGLKKEVPSQEKRKENPGETSNQLSPSKPSFISSIVERQDKILAFLKENGRAQVWQVKQVFPEVTKRTLRRDFEQMFKKGIIERTGERNNTFYQIKINES